MERISFDLFGIFSYISSTDAIECSYHTLREQLISSQECIIIHSLCFFIFSMFVDDFDLNVVRKIGIALSILFISHIVLTCIVITELYSNQL